MKVYFPGPMQETNHPKLGTLVKDKVFDLPAKDAAIYIKAKLLKKKTVRRKTKAEKPSA